MTTARFAPLDSDTGWDTAHGIPVTLGITADDKVALRLIVWGGRLQIELTPAKAREWAAALLVTAEELDPTDAEPVSQTHHDAADWPEGY